MRLLFVLAVLLVAAACVRSPPDDLVDNTGGVARAERNEVAAAAQPAVPAPAPRSVVPPPEVMTDAAITGRIGRELSTDPGMAGADVSVHTDRGVVTLSGTVKSQEQTGIASAHAQRQDGVLRVDNHLRPLLS